MYKIPFRNIAQLLTLQILLFCSTSLSAQTSFDQMRKIPIQSPQAASLARYVEYPVSYFNGRPEISIPLYNVQSGDISLPLSLSYNAGGVRVSDEASWVGLGWALNAGGVITHEIKGSDDDYNLLSFNQLFPHASGNQYDISDVAVTRSQGGLWNSSGVYYTSDAFQNSFGAHVDGEPDLYVYNFGKFSGKFVWLSSTEVLDVSNNNIKFSKLSNGISALAPDGFNYEFTEVETASGSSAPTKMAYYLTKITSPSNDVLTLTYKTFRDYVYPNTGQGHVNEYPGIQYAFVNTDYVRQMPSLSEEYIQYQKDATVGPQTDIQAIPTNVGLNRSFSTSEVRNVYLDKISFTNGYIQFDHGSRKDLFGVKLNGIHIYRTDGTLIKDIGFNYDYFTARGGYEGYTTSGSGNKPPYDESYRKKRLKLNQVSVGPETYGLTYYEGEDGYTLPYKDSFAQDFWGYYNGAYSNTTLVPDFRSYNFRGSVPTVFQNWVGANREPNVDKAIEGSLKKIEYPTKGTAEFGYDLHEFSNGPTIQTVSYDIQGALNTGPGETVKYVDITTDTYLDMFVSLYCNRPADADPAVSGWDCSCVFPPSCNYQNMPNAMYAMLERVDPQTNQVIYSPTEWQFDYGKDIVKNNKGYVKLTNVHLPIGRYKLTANYPDNKIGETGSRMSYISLSIPVYTGSGYSRGGGLRSTFIKNYDPLKNQTIEKRYKYEEGLMMKFPDYYNMMATYTGNVLYNTFTLYANPVFGYSFSANGSPVGYGKVTESFPNNATGKTEYRYIVRQDKFQHLTGGSSGMSGGSQVEYLPGTPSTPFLDNGFLSSVTTYDSNNTILKTIANLPRIESPITYWAFNYRNIGEGQFDYNSPNSHLQMTLYPLQKGKLVTASTTETDNYGGQTVSTYKQFEFNPQGFLKKETQTTSNGSILSKHYRYPNDYNTGGLPWIDDLKTKNIINVPLEVVSQKDDKLIDGSFVTYKSHDNIISPYQVYEAEVVTPVSVPFIAPTGAVPSVYKQKGILEYDANGNLRFSKGTNNISTGYKWGYNNAYQIAECKNAMDTEFFFEDFEGNGSIASNTTSAHTGKGGFTGTVNLVNYFNPGFNSRSYRLSYFTNSGNDWAFVDVPYSGQAISGFLDDIRIYPVDGAITTYTYEPLVGISSVIDPKGQTSYYEYDSYKRLLSIRDQKGNILKNYNYNYSTTLGLNNNNPVYSNIGISQVFTTACPYGTGSNVTYTVAAGTYTAASQDAANALAQAQIDAQGQAYANTNGNCSINPGPASVISVLNGPGTSAIVNYDLPLAADGLQIFIQDMSNGQLVGNQPYTISKYTSSYTATVVKGKTYRFWIMAYGQYYPSGLSSNLYTITLP